MPEMERIRGRIHEAGFYLPDAPEEARSLAETKLGEANMHMLKGDVRSKRRSERLIREAERLELHAFNLARPLNDYEMMGVSMVSAVELRFQLGDIVGAKGLARLALRELGDRSPEFSDRIVDVIRKAEK